jgi:hypothetical protein
MSCEFEHTDGAYVLGALSAAERLAFERHLRGCDACTGRVRQLAGLPGLLGRVSPEVLEDTPAPDVPATVLPALAARVRREQRRRTRLTAALAAAAAALVVGLGAAAVQATSDGPATPPVVAPTTPPATDMEAVGGEVPVTASLTLEDVTWGTRIGLTCTYDPSSVEYDLPPEVTYLLVVRTRTGVVEQVGTWRSVGGRTMRFEAGTATRQDDIASVEVRTTDGRVVLTSA